MKIKRQYSIITCGIIRNQPFPVECSEHDFHCRDPNTCTVQHASHLYMYTCFSSVHWWSKGVYRKKPRPVLNQRLCWSSTLPTTTNLLFQSITTSRALTPKKSVHPFSLLSVAFTEVDFETVVALCQNHTCLMEKLFATNVLSGNHQ